MVSPTRKLRGIGFEVEEMMKLFLVIIIGLGVVILIIAASGGISSLLTEFCAKNPGICGIAPGQMDFNIGKASFDASVMAFNCILDSSTCDCIQKPCIIDPDKYKEEKKLPSIGGNMVIGKGITGFQTTKSNKLIEVKCEEKSQAIKETKNLKTVYSADKTAAENECKVACGTGSVQCETVLKSYIGYGRVRPKNTLLKCTCEYNNQKTIVYAPERNSVQTICAGNFLSNNIYVYGCEEIQDETEYNKYFNPIAGSNPPFSNMRELSSNAKKYECKFSGDKGTETYFTYGMGTDAEAEAKKSCEDDIAYSRNTKSPLTSYSFREIGEISGMLLFSNAIEKDTTATNRIDAYNCMSTEITKSLSCNVKNFNIPDNYQSVPEGIKEYMFGYNDPNFLIYFQDFPEGGDEAWSSYGAWYEKTGEMMLWGMCLADAVMPIGKFAGKKLIVEPLANGVNKVKNAFNRIKDPLTKIGAKFKNVDEFKIAGWDFGAESRLSTYTKAKQWFKTKVIQTSTFVNKPLPNVIIRGGTYTGVDAVSAYYDNLADSKIGKFVIARPQSLVLQVPLKLGEPTKLNDNIRIVDQETGISAVMPIIMGNNKHLALASPCNADLAISKKEIKCESYVYSPDGSMECDIRAASGNEPACDFSSLGGVSSVSSDVYASVKNLVKSQKTKTFEYEGNLLKKIYLPLFETNNYFGDFRQKSGSFYGINYYENGNLAGELEMMCASVQSLTISNAPIRMSGDRMANDLIGKLKNVYYSSTGIELCWFAPLTRFSPSEQQELKKRVEDLLRIGQDSFDVVFVKENNRFIAEIIYPITKVNQYPIILQDNLNEDGNWDSIILDMTTWLGTTDIRPESGYFFTFDDTNIDGKIDSIYSLNCKIPAIQVDVDGTKYNSKYDNNFCYSTASPLWGVGLTTASFAIDAYAKRNPMTYLGAIAVDCGLAYLEHEKGTSWPAGGIK